MKHFFQKNQKGFTIFFATLVASLALAIGLAIFDITVRQLDLSTTVVQSEYAIYAADSGVECALFWDSKYGGATSVFATSSESVASVSSVVCGSYDISTQGTPPTPYVPPPSGWSPWTVVSSANAATTTFTLAFPPYPYCAKVQIGKYVKSDGSFGTLIYSQGYNTCTTNAQNQLEREFQVNY